MQLIPPQYAMDAAEVVRINLIDHFRLRSNSHVLKGVVLLSFIILFSLSAFATHNRAGEITYVYRGDIGPNVYEITITTFTDPDSPADRDSLEIFFDGLSGLSQRIARTAQLPINADIKRNEYTVQHTYPGPGRYIIFMQDPNRVDGIVNMTGSVNVPFYLEDTLDISNPFLGFNSSPVLTNWPIDWANVGEVFKHNPGAYDLDGDSLTYTLIPPKQAPGDDVPGYSLPNVYDACGAALTINNVTGELIWDSPCQPGIYNIAILIREFRNGEFVGSMIRDMEIFVENTSNHPPAIDLVLDTCIVAGDDLIRLITASDPDLGQTITLSAAGGPFVVDDPASFPTVSGTNNVSQTFIWQTNCSHIRKSFYQVVFKAEDDFHIGADDIPLVDLQSWLITVAAPAPEGLLADAIGNRIELTWDSIYSCFNSDNFQHFEVWRKAGCDSTTDLPSCQRGMGGLGYSRIAIVENQHNYTDFDVVRGPVYSYRVIAVFAESIQGSPFLINEVGSIPSDAACAELKRDLPVMINASVRETDDNLGSMFVAWVAPDPDELDTIDNPGPYTYELYRGPGIGPGAPDLIATFNSPSFASYKDTTFIDTLLATRTTQYNYNVKLYAGDGLGGQVLVGETVNASSVFLSIAGADNRLELNWKELVPWANTAYEIWKEQPLGSGNFELIATTTSNNYTDDSLSNGTQYCYRIRALGTYGSSNLPDSLINWSQIACGIPIDTVPSCAPDLNVQNICNDAGNIPFEPSDLTNELSWNNPNNSCADDVIAYNVYYAPSEQGQLEILVALGDAADTFYVHDQLISLAGCYAVTAVDSFGNESATSNVVCVDNCPLYELPNTFTPNGDGQNDLFTPFLPFRFIDRIDIKIFNRWGGLVFESADPMINWDGTNTSGKVLSEGVYYYVCTVFENRVDGVQPRKEALQGYIHLIRGNGKTN